MNALSPIITDDRTARIHTQQITQHIDVEAIRRSQLRVVVDSVHGAGGVETRDLLSALGVGAERFEHYYAQPTGRFPHPPEPTDVNLKQLGEQVRTSRAVVGFAQDPDADRLAIVDEQGRYIGEEYTLALVARHLLRKGDAAAANLSTSRMIDDIAQQAGATVLRSPVGEANVVAAMRASNAALGGEGNGGVIWPKVTYVRDSFAGIALVLEMLAHTGKPLSQLVDELTPYAIVKDKIPFDPAMLTGLAEKLRQAFGDARIDTQDGVRVDFADRWVHVRPSNTEPILRIIAEAEDHAAAEALIAQARAALGV